MIYFNLPEQELSGPGSEKIREVIFRDGSCVVNGDKFGKLQDITLKGANVAELDARVADIIAHSKSGLFAIYKRTPPFTLRGATQCRLLYSEVTL